MSNYNSTVPSSPPQSVTVSSINPASLKVLWQAPLELNQNGPLTGYMFQYTRSGIVMKETVANGVIYVISGLVPFANYSVKMAAMTINGTGPFSTDIIQVSGEGSRLICIYVLLHNYCLVTGYAHS